MSLRGYWTLHQLPERFADVLIHAPLKQFREFVDSIVDRSSEDAQEVCELSSSTSLRLNGLDELDGLVEVIDQTCEGVWVSRSRDAKGFVPLGGDGPAFGEQGGVVGDQVKISAQHVA